MELCLAKIAQSEVRFAPTGMIPIFTDPQDTLLIDWIICLMGTYGLALFIEKG